MLGELRSIQLVTFRGYHMPAGNDLFGGFVTSRYSKNLVTNSLAGLA